MYLSARWAAAWNLTNVHCSMLKCQSPAHLHLLPRRFSLFGIESVSSDRRRVLDIKARVRYIGTKVDGDESLMEE